MLKFTKGHKKDCVWVLFNLTFMSEMRIESKNKKVLIKLKITMSVSWSTIE